MNVIFNIPECFDRGGQFSKKFEDTLPLPSIGDEIWIDHTSHIDLSIDKERNHAEYWRQLVRNTYRVTSRRWDFTDETLEQVWIMVEPLTGYSNGEYVNLRKNNKVALEGEP